MKIFLIGYMGSGKSTIGEKLAYNIKHDFLDLDSYIESEEGRKISEIFAEDGEDYFRKIERVYLHRIIDKENIVISTGGGTSCFFDNMEQMNYYGKTIYLNLHPKALILRLQSSQILRPLLKGLEGDELLDYVCKNLREREIYYNKAHLVVSGFNLTAKKLEEICLEN